MRNISVKLFAFIIGALFVSNTAMAQIDGWSVDSIGTNWTAQLITRNNDTTGWFDLNTTYHSPNSMNISFPPGTISYSGEYASLYKQYNLNDILDQSTSFSSCYIKVSVKDDYYYSTDGYHTKQILVNQSVVWQDDVAGNEASSNNGWLSVEVDVTTIAESTFPYLDIELRVYESAGVSNFGVNTYWDNVTIYFDNQTNREIRSERLKGTLASYAGYWKTAFNGDAIGTTDDSDINKLISDLHYNNSNTYAFLFWYEGDGVNPDGHRWRLYTDRILDSLTANGFKSWAYLAPPTESVPAPKMIYSSYPYLKDYERWAREIAGLSTENTGLVAMSIDDFDNNLNTSDQHYPDYTPEYIQDVVDAMHDINPLLSFIPVCYYKNYLLTNDSLVLEYGPMSDAFLFPYIYAQNTAGFNQSDFNLWNTTNFRDQIEAIRENLNGLSIDPKPLVITDIYASSYEPNLSVPEYVLEIGQKAIDYSDGVCIYTTQKSDGPTDKERRKCEAVRTLFSNGYQPNSNDDQRIYVFTPGDQIATTDGGILENYVFSPYFSEFSSYDQDFDKHQYNLAGDFDGDGYDEIAIFYDYGDNSSDPQRIFVFEAGQTDSGVPTYNLDWLYGTEEGGSWFNTTVSNHNFDNHQYSLVGDYDGNGTDEFALFYDYGDDSSSPQRIFVYAKDSGLNRFSWLYGTEGSGSWYNTTVSNNNFDDHEYSLVGDFDGDSKDEIALFYDYGDSGSDPQRIFVYEKPVGQNKFNWIYGTEGSGSWFNTTVGNHNFDDNQYSVVGDFNGDGKDEFALFYDYGNSVSSPQRIFVYEKPSGVNRFSLIYGTEGSGSWLNTTVGEHNFDCHQYGLAGDFDSDGKDEIAIFYDYGNSTDSRQRIFIYEKDPNNNKFIWIEGSEKDLGWFNQKLRMNDFDCHRFPLVAQLYDEDETSLNRDEIVIFYDETAGNGIYANQNEMLEQDKSPVRVASKESINANNVPLEFKLDQNYPNPFNAHTTISYSIEEESFLTLRIYNVLGQNVKTLVNELKPSGIYNVVWHGEDNSGEFVASGIYYFSLETDSNREVRRMLFLR